MLLVDMQSINIQDIDPGTLVDIKDVQVNMDLPKIDRMKDVIKQMNGNPYFFKSGKLTVKVSFSDTHITIDERMENYLRTI